MKLPQSLPILALLAASSLLWSACGNADEESADSTPAPAETEVAAETEAPAPVVEESTTDDLVMQQFDVAETLAASDKAAQAKDWQSATDNLLKLQVTGSLKTDAESWQYNRRMTVLQNQLLEAADSGDPKAQAAIELLRRSRRVP